MTRIVGLIGYPVEHSLSPVFQQAAFDALGLPIRYELWPTPPDALAARFAALRQPEVMGANITVPYKVAALAHVDHISPRARRAGAINTVIRHDNGQLLGENTDILGFLSSLREAGIEPADLRVVVLGAGGAARGVVIALVDAGCRSVTVANRTFARAQELVNELGGHALPLDERLVAPAMERADLVVNATSVGWDGSHAPLRLDLLEILPSNAVIYDLTYRDTPLLRAARSRGLRTIDGLAMLVHQGAEAFRLWTGQEPPLRLMWAAAKAARDARVQ